MRDIHLLAQYIHVEGKTVFDIGCADGTWSSAFIKSGARVYAIDKCDRLPVTLRENTSFSFQNADIDTFETSDMFDILFARNVFSFCKTPLGELLYNLKKNIKEEGIFFFTYFGDREPWGEQGKVSTMTREEMNRTLAESRRYFDVKYFSEELFEGSSMDGVIKDWHIFKIILKKKKVLDV